MGIFKEDLLSFGRLLDREIEVRLLPEEFRRLFPDFEVQLTGNLMRIRGRRRGFFRRGFEFRAGGEERVYRTEEGDVGVYLRVIDPSGLEELLRTEGVSLEGESLKLSLLKVLEGNELYGRVPEELRRRLQPLRYSIGEGYLSLFLRVSR